MATVIWSPQALGALEQISDFIASDSPEAANRVVAEILDAVDRLSDFPQAGRVIPEIGRSDFREMIVAPYRVTYRVLPDHIRIDNVIHGARDWP